MITLLYKYLNRLLNLKNYLKKDQYAIDTIVKDHRDYTIDTMAWTIVDAKNMFNDLPDIFILNDERFQHQWNSNDCVAYSCANAINTELWYKADKETYYEWVVLANSMRDSGTMFPNWAYVEDWPKEALDLKWIDRYYQVDTLFDIMNAIYRYTNPVCTWTNKIKWFDIRDTWLVTTVSSGAWHAVNIVGWDKTKVIWKYTWALVLENSYWNEYQDGWYFWIPFDLQNKILFNTKKAIYVKPQWSKDREILNSNK